jgi:thioredoxin 1
MRAIALQCKNITTIDDMLYTNLKHIETTAGYLKALGENENVLIICGRMGVNSIQVYRIAEKLEALYPRVKFFDMEFDNPESKFLCALFDDDKVITVPYLVYYRNGEMVYRTSGLQTKEQMTEKLDELILIEASCK